MSTGEVSLKCEETYTYNIHHLFDSSRIHSNFSIKGGLKEGDEKKGEQETSMILEQRLQEL